MYEAEARHSVNLQGNQQQVDENSRSVDNEWRPEVDDVKANLIDEENNQGHGVSISESDGEEAKSQEVSIDMLYGEDKVLGNLSEVEESNSQKSEESLNKSIGQPLNYSMSSENCQVDQK